MNMDQAVVDAVIADWKTAPVGGRLRAALRLLETQTLRPYEITSGFVSELQEAGLDRVAMKDVVTTGFHFNFLNRVTDAYDFPLPDPEQQSRQARILNFPGRRVRPDPSSVMGKDHVARPAQIDAGRDHLFSIQGATDPL